MSECGVGLRWRLPSTAISGFSTKMPEHTAVLNDAACIILYIINYDAVSW